MGPQLRAKTRLLPNTGPNSPTWLPPLLRGCVAIIIFLCRLFFILSCLHGFLGLPGVLIIIFIRPLHFPELFCLQGFWQPREAILFHERGGPKPPQSPQSQTPIIPMLRPHRTTREAAGAGSFPAPFARLLRAAVVI